MITKRIFVFFVSFVAAFSLPLWPRPLRIEASQPGQAAARVQWSGRLVIAMNRRVEGGAEDGEKRATLHELTAGTDDVSRPRSLLPGEIEADYQLSPEATKIAFRLPAGRQVEVLDLVTRSRRRLSLPGGELDPASIQYGWCVDGSGVWVLSGSSLYLAPVAQTARAKLVATAVSPGYFGLDACTSEVAIVARDADRRVAFALSVATLRQRRAVPPLSYTFSNHHVCWRESFALEATGQGIYAIGRREITKELLPTPPRALMPAGVPDGVEPFALGLSAFMRPGCVLGAVGPTAIQVLEIRGPEVVERARYPDQPEPYAALSRTRDQPVWLSGPDRRVVAYVDPDCQQKLIVRDLETRRADVLWPSGRAGDCGESVPLGWATDRVLPIAWLP